MERFRGTHSDMIFLQVSVMSDGCSPLEGNTTLQAPSAWNWMIAVTLKSDFTFIIERWLCFENVLVSENAVEYDQEKSR